MSDQRLEAANTVGSSSTGGPGTQAQGVSSSSASGTTGSTQPVSSAGGEVLAGSPAGPSGSAGGITPGPTGGCAKALSTINIGTVGEYSGIFGPDFDPLYQAVQAWVASENAHGGLDCHPIKYYVDDDGGNPSTNQSDMQTLVQTDHVIAIVPEAAPLAGGASVNYLTQQGVPAIGEEAGSPFFYQSPDFFPQVTGVPVQFDSFINSVALYGKPRGLTKLATISCVEASICSTLYSDAPALAQKYGLQLVYRGQASLTTPDFTSNCQAAQSAGAQLFFIGLDSNSIERLITDCDRVGYHPVFATGGVLATPALLTFPLAEGMVLTENTVPVLDTANPQVAAMDAALSKYAPGVQPSGGTMQGWVAAQLFALAASHLSPTPTSADLLHGLWSIKNNDIQGSTEPLTFTEGQDAPLTDCFWITQIHNKTLVNVGNGQRICQ